MFLPILPISLFLLLSYLTTGVYGLCNETEVSCSLGDPSSCTIRAFNATWTSYLIHKCSIEIAETGISYIQFHVYIEEINGTITLDIPTGISRLNLQVYDTISIEFNQIQVLSTLEIFAYTPAIIYFPSDTLNYFPSLSTLYLYGGALDFLPSLNSTSLIDLGLAHLRQPSAIVTILPSMLSLLPNLRRWVLLQSENTQWYRIIPTSFDDTQIETLYLGGLQHFHSYQFANLTRLTRLSLSTFFTDFTFEENSLSGLDGVTHLTIWYFVSNWDFLIEETFPSLIFFELRFSSVSTLEQTFFERQKELRTISANYNSRFHCDCEMAWLSYVTSNLGWTVSGTCNTPASLNGNPISDSSNYINCSSQSYHCLNNSFICPPDISCVNTADSAYCDCGDGYTVNVTSNSCEDIDECSSTNSCEHNCTNSLGSYTCTCMSGFVLQSDSVSCISSGVIQLTAPIFIFLSSLLLQFALL